MGCGILLLTQLALALSIHVCGILLLLDYIGSYPYAWTVLKPIVSIVRFHIHEFILIFVAWEHFLFSNSVQRSWLYPLLLTLQVCVASLRRNFNCMVPACSGGIRTHASVDVAG